MEKRPLRYDGIRKVTTPRETGVVLPILGLIMILFTGGFVSAFVLTSANIQTLSVEDAALRRQIELLRTQVESMKNGVSELSSTFEDLDATDETPEGGIYDKRVGGKRQIQATSFIQAVLKAQELVFEKYCHDHNATCPSGPVGEKGVLGEKGIDGTVLGNVTSGVVGPPGTKGDQGEPGIQGFTGPSGDKGDSGDTGPKGPIGEQGFQGAQGENGTQGMMGEPGDNGTQGDRGLKGDGGDGGIPGIDGYIGIQGDPGTNGTQGAQGVAGDTGQSGPKGSPSSLWADPLCMCLSSWTASGPITSSPDYSGSTTLDPVTDAPTTDSSGSPSEPTTASGLITSSPGHSGVTSDPATPAPVTEAPTTHTETTTTPLVATTVDSVVGHTIAPIPTECAVCVGPPELCDQLYDVQPCDPPNNYCINHVKNNEDGSREITRSCGNHSTCYSEWFQDSSDNDRCQNFVEYNVVTLAFECTYCCIKDACNVQLYPALETLYQDV